MTKREWLVSTDPTAMFTYLCSERGESRRKAGRRKLRLFACSCVRDIWPLLRQPGSRQALYYSERYADGLATDLELSTAWAQGMSGIGRETLPDPAGHWQAAEAACHLTTKRYDGGDHVSVRHAAGSAATAWAISRVHSSPGLQYRVELTDRLGVYARYFRDIIPNPFRPVSLDPAWRTSTAVGLARTMYESRDYAAMPILADALEEAGCDSADILTHCRSDGPHVRGCWVADLVLGKA